MTEREALNLALQALETLMIERRSIYDKAITAIKEALAQPEQGPMHYYRADAKGNLKRIDIHSAQPEQEPVAWRNAAIRLGEDLCSVGPFGYYDMTAEQWLDWALSVVTVHAPPPQRTWVGLTDEEIKALASWWPSYDQMPALMVLAKDIQNSLKEKNT